MSSSHTGSSDSRDTLLTLTNLCTTADCPSDISVPVFNSASAVLCRKCQIVQPIVMESPVVPTIEGAMISANFSVKPDVLGGIDWPQIVGNAAEVCPVLWVREVLATAARGRTMIVSLPAETV